MCLTGIDQNGYTYRRCGYAHWTEDDGQITNNNLTLCMTSNCNSVIYPPNRLQCYRCNGNDECNFMESTNVNSLVPMPCGRISEPEQCFTYLAEGINRKNKLNRFVHDKNFK